MKIKKLKKVEILGCDFKMIWDKKTTGGKIELYPNQVITVGTLFEETSPVETFDTLVHEVSEAVHILMGTRYSDTHNGSSAYKFFLDHKEFQNHNTLLASTLAKFLN